VQGQAKEKSGGVVLLNPSEEVKTAFGIVGLWDYISIAYDIDSALRSFLHIDSESS